MLRRQRRFLFAVVLLSYLCRDSTTLKLNISSTTDQIIIKEGEPLQLHCYGDSDFFFTYPTNRTHLSDTIEHYTSPIDVKKTQVENGTHWYHFRRPKTVFGDTGWYGCSYYSITAVTRGTYSDARSSLVYVYVESETVRFVEQARLHILIATQGENVDLPCRPTSPTAIVNLVKYHRLGIYKFGNIPIYPTTFDPKFGFTLPNFDDVKVGEYMCYIDPDQEVSYVVYLRGTYTLPKPIINNTMPHVIKGESLYLKCTINVPIGLEHYDIFWILPQQSHRIITWTENQINENYEREKAALLTFENVTYEDEDIYECRVTDYDTEEKSEMYVQVHESLDPFIKLTTWDSNRHYERNEGDEVEWVVVVDAYPAPEIKWFNTNSDEITATLEITTNSSTSEEPKFSIVNTCCKPRLRINGLNLNDMGTYSIQASNQYKKETLYFMLDVLANPKVYMDIPSSHYFENQVANVECYVEAFPKPNITWSYRKCPNYPACDDGTLEYLTNAREYGTEIQLISTLWMRIEKSGALTCTACNIVYCDTVIRTMTVSDEGGDFGIILTKEPVAEGDDWELICAASIHNYSDIFDWSKETGSIVQSDRISIDRKRTQLTYRSILKIQNVTIEDSQDYICTGKSTDNFTRSARYHLEVNAVRAPIIIDTNLNKNEITIDITTPGRKRVDFHCFADGMPKPSISWFKDSTQLVISNEKLITNNSQNLELEYPSEVDSGEYTCRAENRIGKVEVSQRLTIKGFRIVNNRPVGLIVLIVMLAVTVLILAIYFVLKVRRDGMKRRKLVEAAFMHFEKGNVENLNPDLTVDDQADLLPYDNKWEFPKEKLKLGKRLGSGAFGVVVKADALCICEGEAVTAVAVKMVRRAPNLMYICALASELKILVHVGKHLNVVNLLGACTKNILKHELLVIVEFCRFGNLHNYLLRHRSGFINQIDPATGKLDLSIGLELLTRTGGVCSTNSNRSSESDSVQCHAPATDSQGVGMSARDSVLNSASSQPGWSNCRGDYKDSNLKPICTQDLLSWAFQVARGMEYLSQRRVLHGDLAARNILLADDNVVKICDFGLAKSMYKEEIYKKKSDCPLPIKWLAIETMKDRIFSTQSDIWSFGIVLWEFFTLAETPYPGMETNIVYQKLIEGYRMEQPDYATPEVYDIMCQCWKEKPSLRPSFTELVESVGHLLEDNVKAHYIELNAPYLDMNRALLEGGKEDYLMMVSAPDHVVPSSQTRVCTNCSASGTTVKSRYLCTSPKDAVEASPMLKKEEDPYLEPINVNEKWAKLDRNRGTVRDHVVHPDWGYANRNPPNNLELIDLNKKSDEVAETRSSTRIQRLRWALLRR
ncbi:vascular endothelial growth factor receptor 1 [Megalopta genalis]|uniref:vascular endothelial growth factor receptor 1 n=1 Tax=Megalopta genalis TaxID=115081 RepID=UPI003FD2B5C5